MLHSVILCRVMLSGVACMSVSVVCAFEFMSCHVKLCYKRYAMLCYVMPCLYVCMCMSTCYVMLCHGMKSYGTYVMYVLNAMLCNDTLCYVMIRCVKLC